MKMGVRSFVSYFFEIFKDILGLGYLIIYGIHTYISYPFQFILPIKQKSLDKEVILISGAKSQLTKEVCLQLSKTKAKLVLWESNDYEVEYIQTLKDKGVKISYYAVDLSDRNSIDATANLVRQQVGDVTMIINIPEMAPEASILEQSPTMIEKTFETNLLSHFWITREFLPKMIELNHGHIVTICSVAWPWETTGFVPFIGTKCGANGFIESVKDEVKNHLGNPKINFTTIFPTLLRTKAFTDYQIQLRYPILFPVLDDKIIAKRIIEGMRRNKEFVYVPSCFRFLCWIENLVPKEFVSKLQDLLYANVVKKFGKA